MMHKFDWREVERDEYSRSEEPSFVKLTTRSYITAMGVAPDRVTDQAFTSLEQRSPKLLSGSAKDQMLALIFRTLKLTIPIHCRRFGQGAIKSVSATFFDCG